MGRRHNLLSIMVIVVGTVLMDEKQAASNSLNPASPFYASSFSPYYHEPLIGSQYQPAALNSYFSFDKNFDTYYPSSFNPFYQQFISGFYLLDFSTPDQNNFDLFPTIEAPPITDEALEPDLLRTWSIRRACPLARKLSPCSCSSKRAPFSIPVSTIICPAGTSPATTQAIFSNIRPGFNINSVILTLPQGESSNNYIPSIFTLKYPTTSINVIYSTPTTPPPPSCTISNAISPCSCVPTLEGTTGTITCPVGTTFAQIKSAFENIPANTNLGNVILNIPDGTTVLPANLFGGNAANTIQLIGTSTLSKLTIDSKAFTASLGTCTLFSIHQFDVGALDYTFLNGFKVLTEVSLIKCANTPTIQNPPKSFQLSNPLKPISFLVDGIAYNSKCPAAALLDPCKCTMPKGDKVVTVNCPEGSSMLEIMTAFTYFTVPIIIQYGNIGNVIVHFPAATETIIPTRFLGNSFVETIKIIGPTTKELSKLTINKLAFLPDMNTEIWIENFDLSKVDYGFLAGFNYLTTIRINKCTNAPSKTQPPKNWPTADLPNLTSIFVDGTNIFTPALY